MRAEGAHDVDLFADDIRRRERVRRRKDFLWSVLSFFVHAALFTAIVVFTPVRQIVIPEKKEAANPAADLSADRIEELAEKLSEARANELLRELEDMQAALHNMDLMKEELQKDYDAFAAESAKDIRADLEKLISETADEQQKALKEQARLKDAVAELVRQERETDLSREENARDLISRADRLADDNVEKVATAQANAANALDKLAVQAEFAGFRKTAEAAEKVRDAQVESAAVQNKAQTDSVTAARTIADLHWAEKAVKDAQKTRDEKKAELERVRQKKASTTEKRELDKLNRDESNAKRRIEQAERTIAERTPRQKEHEEFRRKNANEVQVERLEKGRKLQEAVARRIEVLRETLAADASELKRLAQENREENELVRRDASALDIVDAYALIRELESAITESYKDIKATETAIRKKMSYAAAQKITDVAKAERLEAQADVLREETRTKEALDRKKAAQAEVIREADSIVETSLDLMAKAMDIVLHADGDSAIEKREGRERVAWMDAGDFAGRDSEAAQAERLAAMRAGADHQLALESAAAEDARARAKDMSQLMAPGGTAGGGGKEMAAKSRGLPGSSAAPSVKGEQKTLLPGNVMRIAKESETAIPAEWMYVNSWYVIGPFPNPNRVNLRRQFPPESVIDLEASYPGKDGKMVSWRFEQARSSGNYWGQSSKSEVVPTGCGEYEIWYAYAEVFFDEACDRWIAVGSDDRSDVWLNGVPVWGSSNQLKFWRVDEGFRKVHFRKGRNRILARIENGWHSFGWSVCISVSEGAVRGSL